MGIVGFTRGAPADETPEQARRLLHTMQASITHHRSHAQDALFCAPHLCTTRTHNNRIPQPPQPYTEAGYHLWLHGELYNQAELARLLAGPRPASDPALFLQLFLHQRSFAFLRHIDGIYAAVLYDPQAGQVTLITDRYGLGLLYWTVHHGRLAWATEVKALVLLPNHPQKIDPLAIQEFFGIGYLLEDRTWYEGIELVPTGSLLTWDLRAARLVGTQRYWWWDDIRPVAGPVAQEEAAEELGRLFRAAVERRCTGDQRIGVLLSGGLDSRAVLAAIPTTPSPPQAITFGQPGSVEIEIAAHVAAVRGVAHHIASIDAATWLQNRPEAVWWTDGHLNMLHMHSTATLPHLRAHVDVTMHAFAGDLILGGSYLTPEFCHRRPIDVAESLYRRMQKERLTRFYDPAWLADHVRTIAQRYSRTDYFFLNNRVRRFTLNGPLSQETAAIDRKPTFDNRLIEFCYALPDALRYRSAVYHTMLLRSFPAYYRTIPRDTTGQPISAGTAQRALRMLEIRARARVNRLLAARTTWRLPTPQRTTNYDAWVCAEPGRQMIAGALRNPGARWREWLPIEAGLALVNDHMQQTSLNAEGVLALLTFELWLQHQARKIDRIERSTPAS